MSRLIDLTGKTFGRWTVIGKAPSRCGHPYWDCLCLCGTRRSVSGDTLRDGRSTSCGCFSKELTINTFTKHGYRTTTRNPSVTYQSWRGMRDRCNNPCNRQFADYGGRGISVCDRWGDFLLFLKDMGECPTGFTLDRYPDTNGNYEPGNCRWANRTQQARNKRNNRRITVNGATHCVAEWAEITGISANVIAGRLHKGWPDVRAVTEPLHR